MVRRGTNIKIQVIGYMKRFIIIAILAVVTSNINLYIRNSYPVNHGKGSDMPVDVCPIKGVSHGSCHHGHDSHHPPSGPLLKCGCSYDYSTSINYEPAITTAITELNPLSLVSYITAVKNPVYTSKEIPPIEDPPEPLA